MQKLSSHSPFAKFKLLLCLAIVLVGISACKQLLSSDIVRYADTSTYRVSQSTLRTVDRTFYGNFSVGDWRYQGANAKFGQVVAYIQIPQKLDMPERIQQQYMQQIICPKDDQIDLWYQLKDVDLEVHLYTFTKQQSVSATCVNPLKNRAAS